MLLQVERRVVNQLASAFEQGLLTKECSVRLSVGTGEGDGATIKLLVTESSNTPKTLSVGALQCPLSGSEPLF